MQGMMSMRETGLLREAPETPTRELAGNKVVIVRAVLPMAAS